VFVLLLNIRGSFASCGATPLSVDSNPELTSGTSGAAKKPKKKNANKKKSGKKKGKGSKSR